MMQIKQHLLKQGCRWLLPLGLLVCWWQTSLHGWMSQQILPGPAVILQTARDFIPGDLLSELPISLYRLALGLAGGITAGIILGVAFGLNGRVSRLILPLFTTLVQIPTLAWIPLLMLWLGIGEALKLTILIKAVSVPVALYTCTGIRQISPKLSEMAKILHLSRRMTLKRLVLPALFPYVMTGVRLALSQGWVTLMAVELLASSEGIGYLLVESRQLFMMDQVYICIAVIGVLGYAGEKLLLLLSHRWIRWPSGISGAVTQPAVPVVDPYGWILPVLLIGGWQWASASGWLNSVFFPAPRVVIRTLITGLQDGPLAQDLGVSIMRMLRGFFLGALAGVLCGLLSGNNAWLDRIFTPFFSALRSVAIFAWLPLITAWFGLGESARTVFIALSAFFPDVSCHPPGDESVTDHINRNRQSSPAFNTLTIALADPARDVTGFVYGCATRFNACMGRYPGGRIFHFFGSWAGQHDDARTTIAGCRSCYVGYYPDCPGRSVDLVHH